jgi:hypothetical protein
MSCTIHLLSFPSILTLHGAHLSGYMNVLVLALSTNARIPGFASLTYALFVSAYIDYIIWVIVEIK